MTSLTRLPQDLEGTGKRSWGDLEGSGLRRVCVALADFVPGSGALASQEQNWGWGLPTGKHEAGGWCLFGLKGVCSHPFLW